MRKLLLSFLAGALALALLNETAIRTAAQAITVYAARIAVSDTQAHAVPAVASDTFALLAATQTLTNKTLTGNIAASFSNTGTVTLFTATDTVVGKATTDALTNKTLDAEGTGNLLTLPFKRWLPAASCQNATPLSEWSTPASDPAAFACDTGTNTQKGTADFADGANALSIQTHLMLPSDWTGAIDVRLKWFTAAITGDVVWQVATVCVADAETSDPAFNAASTVTDTAKGTTLQDNDAAIAGLTATGCTAGDLMYLKVFRDPAHASDTLADTARLRGVELTLRRAM